MSLETATFISGLVATNPLGSDPIASGDDHIRLIKATILNTFPNVTGAVTKTHTQLNNALDKTGDTMTGPLVLSGNPSVALGAATKQYVDGYVSAVTGDIASLSTTVGTKADKATTVSAGTGLSGGGDLSANRTLAIANTGVTAGTYGSASKIPVVTVNAQGQVTSASEATVVNNSIGVGQTWQDVKASRSSGVTYTNNTGRPIMVSVSQQSPNGNAQFYINGVIVGQVGGDLNNGQVFSFIIPDQNTYKCNSPIIDYWWELR